MWILGVFFVIASCAAADDPYVRTGQGLLRGTWFRSKGGSDYMGFLKVPYAAPPVGDLRFELPQEPKNWDGVWDATKDGDICFQKNIFIKGLNHVGGSEDCLYLNVYTKKVNATDSADLAPVMVFIHGGAFVTGSGNSEYYGGEYLMDEDIVYVAMSYRLGPLGFLSMEDEELPGNLGLKDQSFALKWVKKNIKYFGGDPNSVTIFGESAGAASVHYHMLSPMSEGLFHRGISQSGSAVCRWALAPPGVTRNNTIRVAESVGCPTSSTKEMVKCLKGKPAADIINTDEEFMVWGMHPIMPLKPVVEKFTDPSSAFLPEHPVDTIRRGKFSKVPWIVGLTSEEGAMGTAAIFDEDKLVDELDKNFDDLVPMIFFLDKIPGLNVKETVKEIRRYYFGGQRVDQSTVSSAVDLFSDGWFVPGLDESVRIMHEHGTSPVFYYLFSYRGSNSFSSLFGRTDRDMGVCHADDLIYLFPSKKLFPNAKLTPEDEKYIRIFVELWTNFAKTGNPTPELSDVVREKWRPVSSENCEYYHLGRDAMRMEKNLFTDRVAFWNLLTRGHKMRDEL